MSSDESDVSDSPPGEEYSQFGGVSMRREGNLVYPDFRLAESPGVSTDREDPGYPLGEVPKGEGVEYAFEGEPEVYPEMDFRKLANELPDRISIPNTSYLTHAIHKHPAIFIPQIPSYIIRQFTDPKNEDGDRPLVLDPFSGSGTTGVEAKVNGRNYLGIEINPLSRLVSEVSTTPVPPTLLEHVRSHTIDKINDTEERVYDEYDVEFLDGTDKNHWFEPEAIRDLSRIRKVTAEFQLDQGVIEDHLTDQERAAIEDLDLTGSELQRRVNRWLVLMVANTVFEVSNADPGISKAYRSKKMRRKIENGEHPPDTIKTHKQQLEDSTSRLTNYWNTIYDEAFTSAGQQRLSSFGAENGDSQTTGFDDNDAHAATTDIRLGDARDFDLSEYKDCVDLAVTSPPYINAMNYYRGSKLRLFWIYDLLEDDEKFDATELRRSIIGSNAVSMKGVSREMPATLEDIWTGDSEIYHETRLPHLDEDIEAIYELDQNNAKKKAYVTWQFFAEDMLQSLTRVYEHLKPGGYFFFVIGENTIGERLIHSHKYVADIAQHLGKFENHGGEIDEDDGYRFIGSAWDKITNRDLFRGRDHSGGVIECEWVVMLQKPT